MSFLKKYALPVILAGLLIGGAGCAEEKKKAEQRGTDINAGITRTKQKAEEAAALAQKKADEFAEKYGKE